MASVDHPTFNCPRCAGEVQYDGQSSVQRCKYCGGSIPVPPELRPIKVGNSIGHGHPTRRTSITGYMLFISFLVVVIIVAVIGPTWKAQKALDEIPAIPEVLQPWATAAAVRTNQPPRQSSPNTTSTSAFVTVLLQFGEKGIGPGQFTNANLSGVDGEGRVYVGEYTGGRIQVFDGKGKFLDQFFVGDQKMTLDGFVVSRSGVLYIAADGNITRWDGKTGRSLGKITYSGGAGFGELALAPDGSLYALWYERQTGIFTSLEGAREDLVHFDVNGKVLNVLKGVLSSMTDTVELSNSLAVDGRGNVYVAAEFERTIFKFDASGKFITRIGSSGEGASQFADVGAIAIDGQGRIFVEENSDISVLKSDGSRVGKIVTAGAPRCLLFDDAGALWVITDDGVTKYQVKQK